MQPFGEQDPLDTALSRSEDDLPITWPLPRKTEQSGTQIEMGRQKSAAFGSS